MLTFSLGYGPVGRRTYLDGELTMALRQILGFQDVTHAGSVSGRQRTTGGVRARSGHGATLVDLVHQVDVFPAAP